MRANGRASGPVLQSVFLAVFDHSGVSEHAKIFICLHREMFGSAINSPEPRSESYVCVILKTKLPHGLPYPSPNANILQRYKKKVGEEKFRALSRRHSFCF